MVGERMKEDLPRRLMAGPPGLLIRAGLPVGGEHRHPGRGGA